MCTSVVLRQGDGKMTDNYYDREEWSQSEMKLILDSGIDVAVAAKRRMLPRPTSKSIDLGQLAHMFVLGGDPDAFIVSPYADFRTKEARNWKAEAEESCKTIVTKEQYDTIAAIVDNIEAHPRSKELLKDKNVRHEVEMYAKINGIDLRGKADSIFQNGNSLIITDIKTTAQFDEWKRKAQRRHYDLQASVYSIIAAESLGVSASMVNFYFCVAETVAPYRVQYHHASAEFVDSGDRKLAECLARIKAFGDKEPNFLIEEVNELGDWSL